MKLTETVRKEVTASELESESIIKIREVSY